MSAFKQVGKQVSREAGRMGDSPWLRRLARLGYVGSGIIHLLIGWIAVQVALGGGGEADQGGALQALRSTPFGSVLLWVCVVGFFALALFEALVGALDDGEVADRAKAAGKAILYAVMGVTATTFAMGGSKDSGKSSADLTATLMHVPLGRVLVGLLGVGVIGAGAYHVYKGVAKTFLQDVTTTGGGAVGKGVELSGLIGYTAKGVALAVVGGLFILAAWQADPEEATGLDGALKTLADQPLGTVLLLVVALGLVAFGVYSFARARYARMQDV